MHFVGLVLEKKKLDLTGVRGCDVLFRGIEQEINSEKLPK